MKKIIVIYWYDESGAVTVDWVVLTAAIVGLGIVVLTSVSGGTMDLANDTEDSLEHMGVHLEQGKPLRP